MKNTPDNIEHIRTIFRTPEFDEFYFSLPLQVREKFDYVFLVVESVYNISTKFIKHLENSDLYEMRVSVGHNEYHSIIFSIDKDNIIEATQILLINGFLKKSTKDYPKQIKIAKNILKRFEDDTDK